VHSMFSTVLSVFGTPAVSAAVLVLGCSSGPSNEAVPAPPPDGAPTTEESKARTLFVLERQVSVENFASHVTDMYWEKKTAVLRPEFAQTVASVASVYGASAKTFSALEVYLKKVLPKVGAIELDVTGTFASVLLTQQQVKTLFPATTIKDVTPTVPTGLQGVVTHIVGAFDIWTDGKPSVPQPPTPLVVGNVATATAAWPKWTRGSGTHPDCPSKYPADCQAAIWQFDGVPPRGFESFFTHAQLRTAYGVEEAMAGAGRSAVVLEWGQTVVAEHIKTYADGLGITDWSNDRLTSVSFDGALAGPERVEAYLDVETLISMAPGIAGVTILNFPKPTHGSFAAYTPYGFSQALHVEPGQVLPDVISSSFGICENVGWNVGEDETFLPIVAALEPVLITAAAVGVSVILAAGDNGSSDCVAGGTGNGLAVDYPGSSPWVTVVGGTNLELTAQNTIAKSGVWNDWYVELHSGDRADCAFGQCACTEYPCRPQSTAAGGGGRSTIFGQPQWQTDTGVSSKEGTPGYRAIPDVSFFADVYPSTLVGAPGTTLRNGQFEIFDFLWQGTSNGTSQSAPLFAGLVVLLNQKRTELAGKETRLGLATPMLYALGARQQLGLGNSFFDITTGNNKIGGNETQFDVDCCSAEVGFDLASGWGSMMLDDALTEIQKMSESGP
jgi:hypothetical protein